MKERERKGERTIERKKERKKESGDKERKEKDKDQICRRIQDEDFFTTVNYFYPSSTESFHI